MATPIDLSVREVLKDNSSHAIIAKGLLFSGVLLLSEMHKALFLRSASHP